MKILTLILSLTVSLFSYSKEFSYDFIDIEVSHSESKWTDDLYSILISKSITDNFSVEGVMGYHYGDWNDPLEYEEQKVKDFGIEGIYHFSLNEKTDVLTSLQYGHSVYEKKCTSGTTDCTSSYSDSTPEVKYYIPKLGLRYQLNDDIELEGEYQLIKIESSSTLVDLFKIYSMRKINKDTSLGFTHSWNLRNGSDFNVYGLILRQNF